MTSSKPAYQIFNQNCNSKFLILCDHATNHIPMSISQTSLDLTSHDLNRHIAYDIGAKETALELSKSLNAPLISTNFSRLVIDPNRAKNDPTAIMQIYDGTIIAGNRDLSLKQIDKREQEFYDPYHNAINNFLINKKKQGLAPCIVSIHSFAPKLKLQTSRPWQIGVLWDRDTRMSELVIKELAKLKNLCVGENEPYSGRLKGDTLSKHATANKLLHVLIEIRNDLISDKTGQKFWAKTIKSVLIKSIQQLQE